MCFKHQPSRPKYEYLNRIYSCYHKQTRKREKESQIHTQCYIECAYWILCLKFAKKVWKEACSQPNSIPPSSLPIPLSYKNLYQWYNLMLNQYDDFFKHYVFRFSVLLKKQVCGMHIVVVAQFKVGLLACLPSHWCSSQSPTTWKITYFGEFNRRMV